MTTKHQVITATLILIVTIFSIKSCNEKSLQITSQRSVIEEQTSTIRKITVEKGFIVFEKRRAIADLGTLERSYTFLEDTLKTMGVKTKDLETALFIATKTIGKGDGIITDSILIKGDTDTLYVAQKMHISERFFKFSANIFPDKNFDYEYQILDSMSITNTTYRKNVFSPWISNVRVLNANSKVELRGITSLTVQNKQSSVVVGLSVGYGVTNQGISPFIGITATKPIIRF